MNRGRVQLLKLTGSLLFANLLAGVLSLFYLVILARELSLSDFGRYASVVALVVVSEKLFGFQTWTTIVRFGAIYSEQNSTFGWRRIRAIGGVVDFFASVAAAVSTFVVLSFFPADVIDFGADPLMKMAVFLPLLAFGYPTALGIVKHSGRSSVEVGATVGGPLLTLLAFVVLSQRDESSVGAFVMAWALGLVGSRVVIVVAGRRQFTRLVVLSEQSPRKGRHPVTGTGVWRFLFFAKIDSVVLAVRDADVIVVASILGPEITGLYKVARQVSSVLGRASSPLGFAFMPIAAQMNAGARSTDARNLALKSATVVGLLALLLLLLFLWFGEQALSLAFGKNFEAAYLPAALAILAVMFSATAQPLTPLLLTWGLSPSVTGVGFVSVFVYFAVLVIFVSWLGLWGAVASLVLFHLFRLVLLVGITFRFTPRR